MKLLSYITAYIAVLGISRMIIWTDGNNFLVAGIFSLILWIAVSIFFKRTFPLADKRLLICSAIAGFIFSSCMIFGTNIFSIDTSGINHFHTWLYIIGGTFFFAAIIIRLFKFIPELNKISFNDKLNDFGKSWSLKKYFGVSWLLIFIAYLPALLAQYPGIYGYDIAHQITTYIFNVIDFTHPPAHSYLAGFCTMTLGELLGSSERGFMIYILIQIAFIAAIFAATSCYMFAKKMSGTLRLAWQLWFMFFPLNHIMALSATKNILYAVFFSTLILIILTALDIGKNFDISSRIFTLSTIIAGFLGMIFINQGIYVFTFGMIFGILILKGKRIQLLKILAMGLILNFSYTTILIDFLGGTKNVERSLQEMVSIPAVQLSRVAVYKKDELSTEEFDEIKRIFPNCENYSNKLYQGSSDFTRAIALFGDNFKDSLKILISTWVKFGIRYPVEYFDAAVRLTVGQWYPNIIYAFNTSLNQPYFQYESFTLSGNAVYFTSNPFNDESYALWDFSHFSAENREIIKNSIIKNHTFSGFEWLHHFYQKLAYKYIYEEIPVISLLFSTGFIFWCIVIYIFWCVYSRKYEFLFPCAFLIGLWLTLLLGPMLLYRYTLPLALALPILFTHMVTDETEQK